MRRQRLTTGTTSVTETFTLDLDGVPHSIELDLDLESGEDKNLRNWAKIHIVVGELLELQQRALDLLEEQNRNDGAEA
jgi:hypothetical protein